MNKGTKFQFKEYEYKKSLKVFAWSMGSAVITLLISLVASLDIPAEYVIYVPAVNTVLYAVKEYITDNTTI